MGSDKVEIEESDYVNMDILIEILSLISDNSSLAIPVVSIAVIWVTAFIFFHNKQ